MNTAAHFKSLAQEITAIKDRLHNLIGNRHWPTVGAWKESVIRTVLRRHLPPSLQIGTGFIITSSGISTQIDVLIYDDTAPILFRDGDLVIVSADVVRAVIEVKTRVTSGDLREVLQKLDAVARLQRNFPKHPPPFFGLFAYEEETHDPTALLQVLKEVNGGVGNYEIHCISIGLRQFVRFWQFDPTVDHLRLYDQWHCYDLADIAQAYFIHNVIDHLFPRAVEANNDLWYPIDGKESRLVASIAKK